MIALTIELIVNCFQGVISTFFAYKLLDAKKENTFFSTHGFTFAAILAFIITLFNIITIYEGFLSLFYVVIVLAYCFLSLKGTVVKKVFASTIPVLCGMFYPAVVSLMYSALLDKTPEEILSKSDFFHFSALFLVQLLLYFTLKLIWSAFGTERQQIEQNDWIIIASVTLLGVINVVTLYIIAMESLSDKTRYFLIIDLLITFGADIAICWLVINVGKKKYENQELKQKNLLNAYNSQYIENANIEYNLIKKLRHDSMNIYALLDDYISNGKYTEAKKYLSEIYDITNDRKVYVNTGNSALNSIVNAKLSIANSLSIDTTCVIEEMNYILSDLDLCRLLSNMLDNAIHYLSSNSMDNKKLALTISSQMGYIMFSVKNSILSSVLEADPDLNTKKSDKDNHGYGIQVIKDIAEKHNGNVQIYEESDVFCCTVFIR